MNRGALRNELHTYLQYLSKTERYDEENEMSVWDENPFIYDLSVTRCTSSAMLVCLKFKGIVHGYEIYDEHYYPDLEPSFVRNLIGFDSGGHDFCIVDNFLVDYWAKEVCHPDKKWILDLTDSEDLKYFKLHYFEPDQWSTLDLWDLRVSGSL